MPWSRTFTISYFVCGESNHQCEDSGGDSVIGKSRHSLTFAKKPREPLPSPIPQGLGEGAGTWPSLEVDLGFPNSLSCERHFSFIYLYSLCVSVFVF